MNRRGFLHLLGAGLAAGLLPLGCAGPERTAAVLNALCRRMVGPRGAALIDSGSVDLAARAEAWLASLGPAADDLRGALLLLELGVWPLLAKLRPFTSLDDGAQDAVLQDLMASRWALKRQLFAGLKTLACLAFYAAPESHALIGYPGPFADVSEAMSYPADA